jgi:chemotaxis methyl-accepting protein methylase
MSDRAVREAMALLAQRVGWRVDGSLQGRLARCLADGAIERDEPVEAYVRALSADRAVLGGFLDRLTVKESSFFRDPAQFSALATAVLPHLAEPVRVWSAGCANGQEAYTLAMTLVEAGVRRWEVIATDVSEAAVARTVAGRYRERELRGLSVTRRARFFHRMGDEWEADATLRAGVRVAPHNLVAEAPPFPPATVPVVFCRNVLIYLRKPDVVALLDRLATWLPPGGHLFLGYSESLWHVTDRFRLERLGDAFAYRPAQAHAAPSTPPVARTPASRSRVSAAPPAKAPDLAALAADGEAAAAAGDYLAAAAAFRRITYLEPDHAVAHFHLGLALDAAGDEPAARRAYAAARAALQRADLALVEAALEGYRVDELVAVLDAKLRA